jgi:hypothetical protein
MVKRSEVCSTFHVALFPGNGGQIPTEQSSTGLEAIAAVDCNRRCSFCLAWFEILLLHTNTKVGYIYILPNGPYWITTSCRRLCVLIFFAFESIKLYWMFMAFVWGVVRRPVELEGYSPPPELMRILPSSAKSGKKREGGQQIGPNHDDYVLVRIHWLHWASKDCLLYPFRRK